MSFRDTFTRNQSDSENLSYDDNAASYFIVTILTLVLVPLLYSLLSNILNPFSHFPELKETEKLPMFREKAEKFKK